MAWPRPNVRDPHDLDRLLYDHGEEGLQIEGDGPQRVRRQAHDRQHHPELPWMMAHLGRRALLPVGSLVVALAGAFFGVFHSSLWQAFAMMGILGVGLGLTYAALPGLIVGAVPEEATGSALGFYQVLRYIGFLLGRVHWRRRSWQPDAAWQRPPHLGGYTLVLWVGVAVCAAAAALVWLLPAGQAIDSLDLQQAEINAELAPTGFVDLEMES